MTTLTVPATASRSRTIAYWITTVLVAGEFALGSVWDLLRIPYVRTIMDHLGYPLYFAIFMGLWKAPGSIVVLMPRFPRLKEWAYAGMVYEMTGAIFSHVVVGDGAAAVAVPSILLGLVFASWALRPSDRRMPEW